MNIKRLERVLNVQSIYGQEKDMSRLIINELQAIIPDKDIIITPYGIIVSKGKGIRPCFCSHIDTVHEIVDNYKVVKEYHKDDILYSSKTGIGGDDKNGIAICFELLERLDNVQVVFFSGEEVGCLGSSGIDLKYFDHCSCLIGLDRKGNSDIIATYNGFDTINKEFKDLLNSIKKNHGYEYNNGFITDVFTLFERGVDISCINISCGYYNPHSKSEYISLNDMNKCLSFSLDIAKSIKKERYGVEYYDYCFDDNFDNYCDFCKDYCNCYETKYGFLCVDCMIEIINEGDII